MHKIEVLRERAYWEYIHIVDLRRQCREYATFDCKDFIEITNKADSLLRIYGSNYHCTINELAELEHTTVEVEQKRLFEIYPELLEL